MGRHSEVVNTTKAQEANEKMKEAKTKTLSIEEASAELGIGRTLGYELARSGQFPVPVLRLGRLYRVPAAELHRLLGEAAERDAGQVTPK